MVDIEPHLRYRYSKREDVYVGINQLIYYSEGVKPKRVAVDIFVSFDVPSYPRDIYRIAEEGKPPDWVIEVASPSTFKYDVEGKKDLYEAMGVGEYWVYDPQGWMHDPRLQGWVLEPGGYRELVDMARPGLAVALRSEVLGLEFHFDGVDLRMWDPAKQSYLLTLDELGAEIAATKARTAAIEAKTAAIRAQTAITKAEGVITDLKTVNTNAQIATAEGVLRIARRHAESAAGAQREMAPRIAALEAEVKRLRSLKVPA